MSSCHPEGGQSEWSEAELVETWRNKVLMVYIRDAQPAQSDGLPLFSPRIVSVSGRRHLIGEVVGETGYWVAGLTAGICWEDVYSWVVFPSRDDYWRRYAIAPENPAQGGARRGS